VKLSHVFERIRRRQRLRYWALALPLLIIAVALPLLRPLRHPDPSAMADDEFVRLQAIRSIAENGRFALDPVAVQDRVTVLHLAAGSSAENSIAVYPAQEPMLSVIGAGVFQLLRLHPAIRAPDEVLTTYLLTLILSTLPTAVAAVLLYRCARILEISRAKRMLLALVAVTAGGLLPYATVLSPYPLAAMLAVASLACVVHIATSLSVPVGLSAGWFVLAGFLAGLGAAVHPSVAAIGACLMFSMLAMPIKRRLRVLGVLLFALGTLAPVAAHRLLLLPYGDVWTVELPIIDPGPQGTAIARAPDDEPPESPSRASAALAVALRVVRVIAGPFGVLSHYPIAPLAVLGVLLMLTRHWPRSTRALAVATLIGTLAPLAVWAFGPLRGGERMYGPQPLVTTLPILLLFAGVFLRSARLASATLSAHIVWWSLALISFCIGVLGMLRPYPRGGFPAFPPYVLIHENLLTPPQPVQPPPSATPKKEPASAPAGGS